MESRKPVVDVSCARLFRMGRVQREVGGLAARPEGGVEISGRLFCWWPLGEPAQRGGLSSERAGRMVDATAVLDSKIMAGMALAAFIRC